MRPSPLPAHAGCATSATHIMHRSKSCHAFTLVELLVSMAIFSIVLVAMGEMVNAVLNQLKITEARFSQFQEAQAAFDSMTKRISTCEINPYYDFQYPGTPPDTSAVPTRYDLESDLHFVSGPALEGSRPLLAGGTYPSHAVFFHGTYGVTETTQWRELSGLLNSWGYYLEFSDDDSSRASFLNAGNTSPQRFRFRLKELQIPAEQLHTYAAKLNEQSSGPGLYAWFRSAVAANQGHTLAENVIAVIISPLLSSPDSSIYEKETDLAPDYFYDSRAYQHAAASSDLMRRTRHQLPPLIRVTLVALDEASAQKLADKNGSSMPDIYDASLFRDALRYSDDLKTLEQSLQDEGMRYRVFSTTIKLRNSKWNS